MDRRTELSLHVSRVECNAWSARSGVQIPARVAKTRACALLRHPPYIDRRSGRRQSRRGLHAKGAPLVLRAPRPTRVRAAPQRVPGPGPHLRRRAPAAHPRARPRRAVLFGLRHSNTSSPRFKHGAALSPAAALGPSPERAETLYLCAAQAPSPRGPSRTRKRLTEPSSVVLLQPGCGLRGAGGRRGACGGDERQAGERARRARRV